MSISNGRKNLGHNNHENLDSIFPLHIGSFIILLLLIDTRFTFNFDDVFLKPKLIFIYSVLLPLTVLQIVRYFKYVTQYSKLIILILFVCSILPSGIISPSHLQRWTGPPDRADGIIMHLAYIVFALSGFSYASLGFRDRKADMLIQYFSWGGAVVAFTSILQELGLMAVPGAGSLSGISATIAGGTLGNRGYMGGALALLFPFSISYCLIQPRFSNAIPAFLISWALVATQTRGVWLAVGVALLIMIIKNQLVRHSTISIFFGVFVGVLSLLFLGSARDISSFSAVRDSSGRDILYKSAAIGILKKPLTGWGVPALPQAMRLQSEVELLKFSSNTARVTIPIDSNSNILLVIRNKDGRTYRVALPNKVHNEYLDYALSFGMPCAIIFSLIIYMAVFSAWRDFPMFSAAVAAYGCYLLTWPEVIRFAPLAWFIVGIALASRTRYGVKTC